MDTPSNFVVVTLPRSGSYHLVSMLDSAEDVVCHGEVFKLNSIGLPEPRLQALKLRRDEVHQRDLDRAAFLQKLRRLDRDKIFGFKIFPDHMARDEAHSNALMRGPRWKKVFLVRNPLEVYASLQRARATGVWVVSEGQKLSKEQLNAPVSFDETSFRAHMHTYRWFERRLQKAEALEGNPVFTARYERLSDPEHLDALLRFIGSKTAAATLMSDKQRQYSARFQDGFTNWDEFQAVLERDQLLDLIPAQG